MQNYSKILTPTSKKPILPIDKIQIYGEKRYLCSYFMVSKLQ